MIYVDTDRLCEMVRTLEAANHRIDEATNVLMQITTHDSWGCAERHQINDYILQNRKMIQALQSKSGSFYVAMSQISGQFVETENNIGNMFSGLEAILSKILSVPVLGVTGNVIPVTVENPFNTYLQELQSPQIVPICAPVSELWEAVMDEGINLTPSSGGAVSDFLNWIQSGHTGVSWVPDKIDISGIIGKINLQEMMM